MTMSIRRSNHFRIDLTGGQIKGDYRLAVSCHRPLRPDVLHVGDLSYMPFRFATWMAGPI